jgi:hypothetical protein
MCKKIKSMRVLKTSHTLVFTKRLQILTRVSSPIQSNPILSQYSIQQHPQRLAMHYHPAILTAHTHNLPIPTLGPKSPLLYLLKSYPAFLNLFISHSLFFSKPSPASRFLTSNLLRPSFCIRPVSCRISESCHW